MSHMYLKDLLSEKAEIDKYGSMVEEVSVDEAREKMLQINTRICIAILKDSVYNKNYRRS